jgi:hypothetical protein
VHGYDQVPRRLLIWFCLLIMLLIAIFFMLYLCSNFVEFYISHNKLYSIGSSVQIHHIGSATMRWLQLGMLASEGTNSYSCSLLPQPLIYGLERLYRNEKNLILPYISFIGYILNAHNSYTLDSHTRVRLCMHAKKKHLVRLNKQACLYPKFSRKKLRKRCDTSVASN